MNASQNDTLTSTMALNSTKNAAMIMNINSFLLFLLFTVAPPGSFSFIGSLIQASYKHHTHTSQRLPGRSQKAHKKPFGRTASKYGEDMNVLVEGMIV